MNCKSPFLFFGLALVATLTSCHDAHDQNDSAQLAHIRNEENFGTRDSENDAEFVVRSVQNSYASVKFARLAKIRSTDRNLKSIAAKMEEDNAENLDELRHIAFKKGIAIPVQESRDAKDDMRDLSEGMEADFNQDWVKLLIQQYKKSIHEFESVAEKTTDTELKVWINQSLPEFKRDLDQLQSYSSK